MRILIVDDSRAMRMIVARTLRMAGYDEHELIEAVDGLHALEVVAQEPPDVVLCDWNMPQMSGLELLTALRSAGWRIPFGFVTSEASPQMRAAAPRSRRHVLSRKALHSRRLPGRARPGARLARRARDALKSSARKNERWTSMLARYDVALVRS